MDQPVHPSGYPPYPQGPVVTYAGPLASLSRLAELPSIVVQARAQVELGAQHQQTMTAVAATLAAHRSVGHATFKAPNGGEWSITVGAIPGGTQP